MSKIKNYLYDIEASEFQRKEDLFFANRGRLRKKIAYIRLARRNAKWVRRNARRLS